VQVRAKGNMDLGLGGVWGAEETPESEGTEKLPTVQFYVDSPDQNRSVNQVSVPSPSLSISLPI
jgi:hypothetical protein